MEVIILHVPSGRTIGSVDNLKPVHTILDVKKEISKIGKRLPVERQSLRLELRGKSLSDDITLKSLDFKSGSILYCKDLGPQVAWKTVFLLEYSGPLLVYLMFYLRPSIVYGHVPVSLQSQHQVVHLAALCWSFHYAKRVWETIYVHRFSHATMPIRNIFKNCSYYWGFAAYCAYYINHPKYTAPALGPIQYIPALLLFFICEKGNLSIHQALRDLRPPGSKERKIPYPTSDPFTSLFNYVACPNYTYEFFSWLSFAVMTQALPVFLFSFGGLYQMTVWALGKKKQYVKEFPNFPMSRKSILPFII